MSFSYIGEGVSFPSLIKWYRSGGDILIFIVVSLTLTLFIGQERMISRFEPLYWMKNGPALLFPLMLFRETLHSLLKGRARSLAVMGVAAGIWCLYKNDFSSFVQILLFVWVAGWACRRDVEVSIRQIFIVYMYFVLAGILLYLLQPSYEEYPRLIADYIESLASKPEDVLTHPDQTLEDLSLNVWGILPFQTAPAYGRWRISLTPNIATSGIISFLFCCIFLKDRTTIKKYWFALIVSGYFAFFSIIRSVLITIGLLLSTQIALFLLPKTKYIQAAIILLAVIFAILLVNISPSLIFSFQENEFVSRMFLRGQTDMSLTDIYRQAYRPWLWQTHVALFWDSQLLMGQGSELLQSASEMRINAGQARSDSVSLPTRLLATYGLASIGLLWFLVASGWRHLKNNDIWGAVMVAVLFFLMMNWGSVFHPSSAIFVLSFLMIANGHSAFKN